MFSDSENIETKKNLHEQYDLFFQQNDIIFVSLTTSNEEFSRLFESAMENSSRTYSTYTSGAPTFKGFVVESNGTIELPYIGQIFVENKSRLEVRQEIVEKLKEFILDPVVQLKLLNFKVTVLGDVKAPGSFTIPNEKITIFEAIGIAGDINPTADLRSVVLIRESNGERKEIQLDLTKKDVFGSEAYFLRQNDIIYIRPNKAKINTSNYSPIFIPILSTVSIVVTALNIFIRN
ncbi:MAG: hypothetical protein RL264_2874 [Bacteroidota bacterium]|jgi:polysaccharide export outer membrane protein